MKDSKITHLGSSTRITGLPCNPSTPHPMRVEVMLYPFHFPGKARRVEDAAVCLTVATDTEHSRSEAVLLTKNDVSALIGVLASSLAKMASEPEAETDPNQSPEN